MVTPVIRTNYFEWFSPKKKGRKKGNASVTHVHIKIKQQKFYITYCSQFLRSLTFDQKNINPFWHQQHDICTQFFYYWDFNVPE